jgi:type IV pilus assembly protein PilW
MKLLTRSPSALSNCQRGFSLLELLIAMTLGLMVTGAIGYIFIGSNQTFRTQDGLARMQENARYTFDIVSQDVRMAGFNGCGASVNATVLAAPSWFGDLNNALLGYEATSAGATAVGLPAGIAANAINGTDALTIVRADESTQWILAGNPAGTVLATTANHGLVAGDIGKILVACDASGGNANATVFAIAAPTPAGTAINTNAAIGNTYPLNTRLLPIHAATYYLRNNVAGQPSLYRETLTAAGGTQAEELAPGVEDMQITYGVDTDDPAVTANATGPNEYQTADEITNNTGTTLIAGAATAALRWQRVRSVHISLLMRTEENNVIPQAQTYAYNGATPTAADLRLRKVFTHVIAVRSR